MREYQELILNFLQTKEDEDDNFQNLLNAFEDHKTREKKHELKSVLHLISIISNNFHKSSGFYEKIEKIINIFKEDFKRFFSNYELFIIFSKNKRILHFLFNEKLIIADQSIYSYLYQEKFLRWFYIHFFFNELKEFISNELLELLNPGIESNDIDSFREKQKNGQNDKKICQLIQNDSIDDFIVYVTKENIPLSLEIEPSVFETNSFLLKNKPSLIEYAAFYGSIQIFQYLRLNNIELTSKLWLYVIHGENPDLIHILEENNIKPPNNSFVECYIESIKCHHIDIMNYIKNNLIEKVEDKNLSALSSIQFYNFINLCDDFNNKDFEINDENKLNVFYHLCKYDYIDIVDFLLNNDSIDVNSKIITNFFL